MPGLADVLTPRQLAVARLVARGLIGKEIAAELGVAYETVRSTLYNPGGVCERLGARGVVDVARAVWEDGMAERAEEPVERGWDVRPDAVHWVPDPLPAGDPAWTDYRGDDCQLRRRKPDERSRPVVVAEPLFPGDRARVRATDGGWEAVKVG